MRSTPRAATRRGSFSPSWVEALHRAAAKESAEYVGATPHGDLYTMDFMPHHEGKAALVRSVWMVRKSESVPRLVSCYVHKSALRGNA
ncbi:MAG: DUF6883 domain-containing protein [Acidiferrobacter thiooxydans]